MLLMGDSCYAPSCSCGAETAKAPLSLPHRTWMCLKSKSAHICRSLGLSEKHSTSLYKVFGREEIIEKKKTGAMAYAESLTLYAFRLSCENKQSVLLLYSTASQNLDCVYLILSGRHSTAYTHTHTHGDREYPDIWSI